jgi:hypothetical protein
MGLRRAFFKGDVAGVAAAIRLRGVGTSTVSAQSVSGAPILAQFLPVQPTGLRPARRASKSLAQFVQGRGKTRMGRDG